MLLKTKAIIAIVATMLATQGVSAAVCDENQWGNDVIFDNMQTKNLDQEGRCKATNNCNSRVGWGPEQVRYYCMKCRGTYGFNERSGCFWVRDSTIFG